MLTTRALLPYVPFPDQVPLKVEPHTSAWTKKEIDTAVAEEAQMANQVSRFARGSRALTHGGYEFHSEKTDLSDLVCNVTKS